MEWVNQSPNFTYLRKLCDNIDPHNEGELAFKMRLDWLLNTVEEQAMALHNIEMAQNSDLSISSIPPRPSLTLIKGGKS